MRYSIGILLHNKRQVSLLRSPITKARICRVRRHITVQTAGAMPPWGGGPFRRWCGGWADRPNLTRPVSNSRPTCCGILLCICGGKKMIPSWWLPRWATKTSIPPCATGGLLGRICAGQRRRFDDADKLDFSTLV